MELRDIHTRFSTSTENQEKAVFSTIFFVGNRLQTIFDRQIPGISLKQFMLLSMVKQSEEQLTFTQLGNILGCSRQNVKKLAYALEQKGFVVIRQNERDVRASSICPTGKMKKYFETEFVRYETELRYLFEVYTADEIADLFHLLGKLYTGIERLEEKTGKGKVEL